MGSPIPVEIAKWTPTSYGVWTLVIVQLFFVLGLIVRKGPEWFDRLIVFRKQGTDAAREERAAVAAEKAAEETRAAAAKMQIAERMTHLEERVTRMGNALSFVMNAAILSTNALETTSPGSPAIKQSRDLIAMAASTLGADDDFSKALSRLATVTGRGE